MNDRVSYIPNESTTNSATSSGNIATTAWTAQPEATSGITATTHWATVPKPSVPTGSVSVTSTMAAATCTALPSTVMK